MGLLSRSSSKSKTNGSKESAAAPANATEPTAQSPLSSAASPDVTAKAASSGASPLPGTVAPGTADATLKPIAYNSTMESSGLTYAPKQRKHASVIEMLDYVRGLNIDPIKESDMLWIAEEAFNTPLPPGWTEQQDEQGKTYFHSATTGESVWRHPMDDLFREVVGYQRRVVRIGGFWEVEDEISELEESIRSDLSDWMELYDDKAEKFYYNRRTDESRFDDPRMAVYHSLYARIKMVAKMKERLPLLARNTRQGGQNDKEQTTPQKSADDERYVKMLIKIQSMGRMIIAKRRVKEFRAKAVVHKGPQPLRGQMRLRMEKVGPSGSLELVLGETTPHKRARAAAKIQARHRGKEARKLVGPMIEHRRYQSSKMLLVQCAARMFLARRRVARKREERKAIVSIQSVHRGQQARRSLKAEKAEPPVADPTSNEPVTAAEVSSDATATASNADLNEKAREALTTALGEDIDEAPPAATEDNAEDAASRDLELEAAAVKIQAVARGSFCRKDAALAQQLQAQVAADAPPAATEANAEEAAARDLELEAAAVKIQAVARGSFCRKDAALVQQLQAQVAADATPSLEEEGGQGSPPQDAATIQAAGNIQAAWRGKIAREHVKGLRQEAALEDDVGEGEDLYDKARDALEAALGDDVGEREDLYDKARDALEAALGDDIGEGEDLYDKARDALEAALGDDIDEADLAPVADGAVGDAEAGTAVADTVGSAEAQPSSRAGTAEGSPPTAEAPAASPQDQAAPASKEELEGLRSKAKAALKPAKLEAALKKCKEPEAADQARAASPQQQRPPSREAERPPSRNASERAQSTGSKKAGEKEAKGKPKSNLGDLGGASKTNKTNGKHDRTRAPPVAAKERELVDESTMLLSDTADSSATLPAPKATAKSKTSKKQATKPKKAAESSMQSTSRTDRSEETDVLATSGGIVLPPVQPPTRKVQKVKPLKVEMNEVSRFLNAAHGKYRDIPPEGFSVRPRPPERMESPAPPAPSGRTAAAASAGATASSMKLSQSDGAIEGLKSTSRKTYGGTLVGGRFVRNHAESVDDMSRQEREACLADIEARKQMMSAELKVKRKAYEERQRLLGEARQGKYNAQMGAAEALQEDRRRRKVAELKSWLKLKEDQVRAKKEREDKMVNEVLEKEKAKTEANRVLEEKRVEERERRLKIGQKQKEQIAAQMIASRAERAANRSHNTSQMSNEGASMPSGRSSGYPPMAVDQELQGAAPQQRVVHRHIHHHVHYHEGSNVEGGPQDSGSAPLSAISQGKGVPVVSTEEQRQIEMASEARVREKLEVSGVEANQDGERHQSHHFHQHLGPGMPYADPGAVTPTSEHMRKAHSMGALAQDGNERTQEAFYRPAMPGIPMNMGSNIEELGKQKGLEKFAGTVNKAFSAYANAGRLDYNINRRSAGPTSSVSS